MLRFFGARLGLRAPMAPSDLSYRLPISIFSTFQGTDTIMGFLDVRILLLDLLVNVRGK
jgi:hypothetical protein